MFWSTYGLFAGWATLVLFGLPAIFLMFRLPKYSRILGLIAVFSGLAQLGYFIFSPWSPYRDPFERSSFFATTAMWWAPPILPGLIAIIGSRIVARRMAVAGITCGKCGYSLRGNQSGICSECGAAVPSAQLERVWKITVPASDEQVRSVLAEADAKRRAQDSGAVRRIVLALAVGAPLSAIGFVCGAISVHAGPLFAIPHLLLCPLLYAFSFAVSHLPIFLRKALAEGATPFQTIAVFCLLQFLYFYLLFGTVDWVRAGGPRRLISRSQFTNARSRRYWIVVPGLIITVSIGMAVALYLNRGVPFDSDTWKTLSQTERGRMANDLVKSGRLIGQSPSQVISLLGTPTEHSLSYDAGEGRLLIDMGEDGRRMVRLIPPKFVRTTPSEPFTPERWRIREKKDRLGMAVSLQAKPEFFSKDYDELIRDLGAPNEDDETIAYHVGRYGRIFLWVQAHQIKGAYLQ